MTGLSYNSALFCATRTVNDARVESFIPLYPVVQILIQKQYVTPTHLEMLNSRVSNHAVLTSDAITIPLPLVTRSDAGEQSVDARLADYFREESYTATFYPYPEQSVPRPPGPVFRFVCTHDVIPVERLMVCVRVGREE